MKTSKLDRERLQQLASRVADGKDVKDALGSPLELNDFAAKNLLLVQAMEAAVISHNASRHGLLSLPADWGHLRLTEVIGEGSYGVVYRARDPILDRDVALKLRTSGSAKDAEYIEEARRLARVRHPNVLAVHGANRHDGRVGMWADLLTGKTLEDTLALNQETGGHMPYSQLLALARDLAAALGAVHETELVHGDVKPANVMIERHGRAVLMDFGAGIDPVRDGQAPLRGDTYRDGARALCGTTPRTEL